MSIPDLPNLIYYAIPFFIISVIVESVAIYYKRNKEFNIKDSLASITMGVGNLVSNLLSKVIVVFIFTLIYNHYRLFTIPFTWYSWLILLFLDDFCYYWSHRLGHESRFFWASHVVHHSSQKYNLSTALRQTWTGGFFSFIFYIVLPFIGFHPIMIFMQMSINLLYQYWIHTEFIHKMPKWFEAVFNTPSHHRVHHGANPLYLDRNYAGIFIIWDKLFNTFQEELPNENHQYGLTKNIHTYNPFKIAFLEWISVFNDALTKRNKFINRLKYFIKPPGWQPNGKAILSKDLRTEYLKNKTYL
ncbi:MAG: sterol desaturase family protein [Lutibacter sp.]